ncbi:MAG: helix-turn-helix domain-containing protein, partial [Chthoniobacterales bacterium]
QLRWARGLRQRDLAARLQIIGWNVSRVAVSKIESHLRCVADYELLLLAKALRVNVGDLFPKELPPRESGESPPGPKASKPDG